MTSEASIFNYRHGVRIAEAASVTVLDTGAEPRVMLPSIIAATSIVSRFSVEDITYGDRTQPLARWRQIAMYVARTRTRLSYPQIAQRFGQRDHTTVLYATRVIAAFIANDPDGRNAAVIARVWATAVEHARQAALRAAARRPGGV